MDFKNLYKLAAWSSILLLLYSLSTILVVALIGGPPQSAEECFQILNESKIKGLLRLDVLTIFVMPLYYVLFLGMYFGLRKLGQTTSIISLAFIFVGVTLFLAAPSVFSFVVLSDKYVMAANDMDKSIALAAGEALLATDIWHGTGPRVGGILSELGALLFSILMLRYHPSIKLAAYIGIITHGLDLTHVIVGFFNPSMADSIMIVAGPLYLIWFPLITRWFFKLSIGNES